MTLSRELGNRQVGKTIREKASPYGAVAEPSARALMVRRPVLSAGDDRPGDTSNAAQGDGSCKRVVIALGTVKTKNREELLRFRAALDAADPGHTPQAEDQAHSPTDAAANSTTHSPAEVAGGSAVQPRVLPQFAQDQPTAVTQLVQHQRRLTSAECAEVASLYLDGVPMKEICQRFGIGKQRIRAICARRGIKPRTRGVSDAQKHQAEQLYAEGLSTYKIAARLAVSDDVVWRHLRSIGATMRTPGRPREAIKCSASEDSAVE